MLHRLVALALLAATLVAAPGCVSLAAHQATIGSDLPDPEAIARVVAIERTLPGEGGPFLVRVALEDGALWEYEVWGADVKDRGEVLDRTPICPPERRPVALRLPWTLDRKIPWMLPRTTSVDRLEPAGSHEITSDELAHARLVGEWDEDGGRRVTLFEPRPQGRRVTSEGAWLEPRALDVILPRPERPEAREARETTRKLRGVAFAATIPFAVAIDLALSPLEMAVALGYLAAW